MYREEAIKILNHPESVGGVCSEKYVQALRRAFLTLELEPCEDAISRKAMLKYQRLIHDRMPHEENLNLRNYIQSLPSITPDVTFTRKHGEWKDKSYKLGVTMRTTYQCSECDNYFDSRFNFCPNCGADMRGGEERKEPSEWQQDHAILKAHSDGANEVIDRIKELRGDVSVLREERRTIECHCGCASDVADEVLELINKLIAESEE